MEIQLTQGEADVALTHCEAGEAAGVVPCECSHNAVRGKSIPGFLINTSFQCKLRFQQFRRPWGSNFKLTFDIVFGTMYNDALHK